MIFPTFSPPTQAQKNAHPSWDGRYSAPGEIRTHDPSLRSTKNRLIHTVLRCYAMFLKPLKYKAFVRIPCFLVSLGFVLFFRLFLRPVSKMLAEPGRETNTKRKGVRIIYSSIANFNLAIILLVLTQQTS